MITADRHNVASMTRRHGSLRLHRSRRWSWAAVALLLAACTPTPAVVDASPGSTPSSEKSLSVRRGGAPPSWTAYHATPARTGAVRASTSFAHPRLAWSDNLGAEVHGQAVVADGRIFAATERNRVVALDPANGKILWSRTLGRPLTQVASVAGCGDIDPLGITSTPVIDTRSSTLYVVGEISNGHGGVTHRLEGLSLTTGRVRLREDVDPPLHAESPRHLLQRAGLALANGRVYIAYGGNDGDCGSYHGWVVGVNERGPAHRVTFEVASDGHGGAIWEAGGAPAVGPTGDLYVTTGNANPDPPQGGPDPKKYTESVVELSPRLRPLASFKDRIAGGDEDLATGNPVLLPNGEVFAVGKTDVGYLLRRSNLQQVGSIPHICGSNPDGGSAYYAAARRLYVPCRGGGVQIVVLTAGGGRLGPRVSGADSAPIVINSTVWALNHDTGVLYGYDGSTGRLTHRVPIHSAVPIFTSPSTALGLLLVPTNTGLTAVR